tara:strand:- start:292 stop:534 length:243 start_codon:yes stop_codon:yes gene_type:complete
MSKLQVDDIVNKDDTGSAGFSRGAVVTGIATATSFDGNLTGNVTGTASEASAAKSGSALETSINGKTSPGKAIALSMVFG